MSNLFDELTWRGMVYRRHRGVADAAREEPVTAYIGFDPTASSLHVGSLLHRDGAGAAAALWPHADRDRRRRHGHDWRSERQVAGTPPAVARADRRERRRHPATARRLSRLRRAPAIRRAIVNNADWLGTIDLLSFLRDTGKHFTVNYMLQKESVNRRLESEEGISFTEFSYLLLQAHDFLELSTATGARCRWAAAISGGTSPRESSLIRKLRGDEGARAGVAADEDGGGREVREDRSGHGVARSRADLAVPVLSVLAEHRRSRRRQLPEVLHVSRSRGDRRARRRLPTASPERREAQRVLAREVTTLVHGADQVARAEHASSAAVRRGHRDALPSTTCWRCSTMCRRPSCRRLTFGPDGIGVVDLLARVQLAPSKSEARRLVQSGGVYVNNRRVSDPQAS